MKETVNRICSWAAGISAMIGTVGMSGCEEFRVDPNDRPDPVNLREYDITEIEINFDRFDDPTFISFLAVKPNGNECTQGVQSQLEYNIDINQNLVFYEAAAFVGLDIEDFTPQGNFGAGRLTGQLVIEANSQEGFLTLGFRDCATQPDAMRLYLENALVITNAIDSVDAKQVMRLMDRREYNVENSGPVFASGDFTP